MPRAGRRPHETLTLLMGSMATALWAFRGAMALAEDAQLSTSALFAVVAFTLTGFGLGAVVAFSRDRPGRLATEHGNPRMFFMLMGLLFIGLGAGPVHSGTVSGLDWAYLVMTSVAGGCFIAVAATMRSGLVRRTRRETEGAY